MIIEFYITNSQYILSSSDLPDSGLPLVAMKDFITLKETKAISRIMFSFQWELHKHELHNVI